MQNGSARKHLLPICEQLGSANEQGTFLDEIFLEINY